MRIVLNHIDRFTPSRALLIIDLAQIQYLALNDAVTAAASVLDNAPVPMFFAVFHSAFGPQKHANSLPENTPFSIG